MKPRFTLYAIIGLCCLCSQAFSQVQGGATCDDALAISCGQSVVTAYTYNVPNDNATSGALSCVSVVGTAGQQWYSFSDADGAMVTLSTCATSSTFDTQIHVFTGECGSLTCLTGNDDACELLSTVSFIAEAGETYLVRVGGYQNLEGFFALTINCTTYNPGCTYPAASNYDPEATFDDGSCIVLGCTDPGAMNYNQFANTDDGSCTFCDGEGSAIASLYVCAFANGGQISLTITDSEGNVAASVSSLLDYAIYNEQICLHAGECYTVTMTNTAGLPGWNNGYFWINVGGVQVINESLNGDLITESTFFSIDGTCAPLWGCTDAEAINYNPDANEDDGSCVYPFSCEDGTTVGISMTTGLWPNECYFYIVDENGNTVYYSPPYAADAPYATYFDNLCLSDGCYALVLGDTWGDGWLSGVLMLTINNTTTTYTLGTGTLLVTAFGVNSEDCEAAVTGCTDPNAENYNPEAIYSDGSCIYAGCTDPAAINYNWSATLDDGSCEYCDGPGSVMAQLYVCTYGSGWQNELQIFDDQGNLVTTVNGLGDYQIYNTYVCLQAGVCYTALMNNNVGPLGWSGGYFWINAAGVQIVNAQPAYNAQSQSVQFSIDGTCGPVVGCMDPNALNYNPEASIPDNSCTYGIYGCTDSTAVNYNPQATTDDGSCVYAQECTQNTVVLVLYQGVYVGEASYDVIDANGVIVLSGSANTPTAYACLPDGCYTINMYDAFGDGWSGGGYVDVIVNGLFTGSFTLADGLYYGIAGFGVNAEGCEGSIAGCTDPNALNYNPFATEDDGSCTYSQDCQDNLVTIWIVSQTWGSEMSWSLVGADGAVVASGSGYTSWNTSTITLCLPDGCYELQMSDSWGDGWNGGYYMISSGNNFYEGSLFYGSNGSDLIGINSDCGLVAGCMDPAAINYNPEATYDDGSCSYNNGNFEFNSSGLAGLELEFSLFPNPTNGGIVIDLNNLDDASGIYLNVMGLDGKKVGNEFFANSEASRRLQVDVSDFAAGYYFVQVVNGTNVKVLPLIKE